MIMIIREFIFPHFVILTISVMCSAYALLHRGLGERAKHDRNFKTIMLSLVLFDDLAPTLVVSSRLPQYYARHESI